MVGHLVSKAVSFHEIHDLGSHLSELVGVVQERVFNRLHSVAVDFLAQTSGNHGAAFSQHQELFASVLASISLEASLVDALADSGQLVETESKGITPHILRDFFF